MEPSSSASAANAWADWNREARDFVDNGQAILPGFRRYVGPAPRPPRQPWIGRWWDRGFLGLTWPVERAYPKDGRGKLLVLGPLQVIGRTDGRYCLIDRRQTEVGRASVYLGGAGRAGLREVVAEMVRRGSWISPDERASAPRPFGAPPLAE